MLCETNESWQSRTNAQYAIKIFLETHTNNFLKRWKEKKNTQNVWRIGRAEPSGGEQRYKYPEKKKKENKNWKNVKIKRLFFWNKTYGQQRKPIAVEFNKKK